MLDKILKKMGYVKRENYELKTKYELMQKLLKTKIQELSYTVEIKENEISDLKSANETNITKNRQLQDKIKDLEERYRYSRNAVISSKNIIDSISDELKESSSKNKSLQSKIGGITKELNKLKSKYLFALKVLTGLSKKDESNMTCFKIDLKKLEKWNEERLKLK